MNRKLDHSEKTSNTKKINESKRDIFSDYELKLLLDISGEFIDDYRTFIEYVTDYTNDPEGYGLDEDSDYYQAVAKAASWKEDAFEEYRRYVKKIERRYKKRQSKHTTKDFNGHIQENERYMRKHVENIEDFLNKNQKRNTGKRLNETYGNSIDEETECYDMYCLRAEYIAPKLDFTLNIYWQCLEEDEELYNGLTEILIYTGRPGKNSLIEDLYLFQKHNAKKLERYTKYLRKIGFSEFE